jgi:hypothetical protein
MVMGLGNPRSKQEGVESYSVFLSVILSEAKDLRGAMRPSTVLQSSVLWLSHTLKGNLF